VLALALIGLAGCGPGAKAPDLPHAPSSLTPRFYAPRGWTWGVLKLKDGTVLRYGVASPSIVPRGDVLLIADRAEPMEVWFETANDLIDRGYTVWALEPGGAKSASALDPANGAFSDMIGAVIRPHRKLVVVAQGLGATLSIRGLSEGDVGRVAGAVLASPALTPAAIDLGASPNQVQTAAEWATRFKLGWLVLPGDGQPRLGPAPLGLDPHRAGLAAAWRRSDPSLKPKRTTLGWVWGYDQGIRSAQAPEAAGAPVIMAATASDQRAAWACKGLKTCTLWAIPTSAPHLARNEVRKLWLQQIVGMFDTPPR
jgi:lysophospholipase